MATPTYDFFGGSPVQVVFQTTDNFDGSATSPSNLAAGVITPCMVVLPAQSGGGRLDFHTRPLKIDRITVTHPGGSHTAVLVLPGIAADQELPTVPFMLPVGAYIKFTSTGAGAKQAVISAREIIPGTNIA